MAQRTIHYLFGQLLCKQFAVSDQTRFLLGTVIPDAVDPVDRSRTHFKTVAEGRIYYDFSAFRQRYQQQLLVDPLYLGYYMHLVEDAFYRQFLYIDRITRPKTPSEIRALHNDYHILNGYIVNKYGLKNILTVDPVSEGSPLPEIAAFHVPAFLREMAEDFTENTTGTTVYVTEKLADEFIETYLPLAIREMEAIIGGNSLLDPRDFSWPFAG